MSLNRGKAKANPAMKKASSKARPKKTTTAATAGIPKRAVMNSRSPKKDVAISGDTMSSYAMYKKGGSTFPDLTGDGKVTKADILKGRGVIKKGGTIKKKK